MIISSTQNPKIKHLLALQQKSSLRREEGLFVVEGRREIGHCVEAGYDIDTLFTLDIQGQEPLDACLANLRVPAERLFTLTPNVYEKVAYRDSTEGAIAIVRSKSQSLSDLPLPQEPLIVVLESVEKPGNLGAVLRSADAAGVDAVVVCDPLTDLYNPNLIRSSIGAVFTVPVVACTSQECIAFLKARNIKILTAQLQDSELYYATDMTCGTAIVMGTEATGLTTQWRKAADAHIRIPMLGALDSLNVSVSAAILMYEAVRQRTK